MSDETKRRGRPVGGQNSPKHLPPMWLVELLEGPLSSRCLDNQDDRREVAQRITREMMDRMMYKTPDHQGGRLRSRKRTA